MAANDHKKVLSSGVVDVPDIASLGDNRQIQKNFAPFLKQNPEIIFSINSNTCEYFFYQFEAGMEKIDVEQRLESELLQKMGGIFNERAYAYQYKSTEKTCVYGATFPKALARFIHRFIASLFSTSNYLLVPGNFAYLSFFEETKVPRIFLNLDEINTTFTVIDSEGIKISKIISYGYSRMINLLCREKGLDRDSAKKLVFNAGFPGRKSEPSSNYPTESKMVFKEFQSFLKRFKNVLDFALLAYPRFKNLAVFCMGALNGMKNYQYQLGSYLKREVGVLPALDEKYSGTHQDRDTWPDKPYSFLFSLDDSFEKGLLTQFAYNKRFEAESSAAKVDLALGKPLSYTAMLLVFSCWFFLLYKQNSTRKELAALNVIENQFKDKARTFLRSKIKNQLFKEKIELLEKREKVVSKLGSCLLGLGSSFVRGITLKKIFLEDPDAVNAQSNDWSFAEFQKFGKVQRGRFTLRGTATTRSALENFMDEVRVQKGFHQLTIVRADYSTPKNISFHIKGSYTRQ
ncbi:hypothetical protein ACFL35_09325 [Candidatus Riflebacteria bacterium]